MDTVEVIYNEDGRYLVICDQCEYEDSAWTRATADQFARVHSELHSEHA